MTKTILFLAFLLCGCNSGVEGDAFKDPAKGIVFSERGMSDFYFYQSSNFNGKIDIINENSWRFTSHENELCKGKINSSCRKVNAKYHEGQKIQERVTKTSFIINVSEININEPPEWIILYQDWVRIIPTDTNGNHPISTLKLKVFNGKLNVCHYRNDWQWGYDFSDNYEGSNIDTDHSLHQENTKGGCYEIYKGVNHKVEILNFDNGFFQLYVDDDLISHVQYKTKSESQEHVIQWGMYWSKGYNKENNTNKRIVLEMKDFIVKIGY